MKPRARILRMTRETGPRSIFVLMGINRHGEDFSKVFKAMRAAGDIVKYGAKKGRRRVKWGAPGWKRPPRRRFE